MTDAVPIRPPAELRDYVNVLLRRRWSVILTPLVFVAAALAVSFSQTSVYSASAQVQIEPSPVESILGSSSAAKIATNMSTEAEVVRSAPVRELVRDDLGRAPTIGSRALGSTSIIVITAESERPAEAAATANAYARAYMEYRRTSHVDELLSVSAEIQKKIDELQGRIDEINRQIFEADDEEETAARLAPQRESVAGQQTAFRGRLDQLEVATVLSTGGGRLLKPAAVPSDPVRPDPLRSGVVALVLGLVAGVAFAFVREHLVDTIRFREDAERAAGDLPVLATIPLEGPRKRGRGLVMLTDDGSPVAGSYRTLGTSLLFLAVRRPVRIIEITSPGVGEGKSTTTGNAAVALARAGWKVLAVDCDLRAPRLHELFDVPGTPGLSSVLLGEAGRSSVIREVPGEPNLAVLPAGPPMGEPSELLGWTRTGEFLRSLAVEWDFVLLDSPPVLQFADSTVLSAWSDATVIVAAAGLTSRRAAERARETLRQVGAPLVGLVVNGIEADVRGYGYGPSPGQPYGAWGREREVSGVEPVPEVDVLANGGSRRRRGWRRKGAEEGDQPDTRETAQLP